VCVGVPPPFRALKPAAAEDIRKYLRSIKPLEVRMMRWYYYNESGRPAVTSAMA
jgi:hypothetical protein